MSKIEWRIKYAKEWQRITGGGFREGFYMSRVAANEGDYYEFLCDPEKAILEELSYWS